MFEIVCFGYEYEQPRRIYCDSREKLMEVYQIELYNPLNFSVQAREYKVVYFRFRD